MKTLKVMLAIMMMMVLFSLVCIAVAEPATTYIKMSVVVACDEETEEITVIDTTGNYWIFYGNDWCIGDIAILLMNDANTETLYDDEIIETYYGGHMTPLALGLWIRQ